MNASSIRTQLNKLLTERQHHKQTIKEEKSRLAEAKAHAEDCAKALALVQSVAKEVQQKVHNKIAGLVTRCLETVFPEPYEFRILFEEKRGKTEARFTFFRDGYEVDPMQASGGGVVDVAAFALRLSAVLLSRPHLRRLLVLDEPFRFVDEDNRPRLRALIESLTRELGFQIILVTHIRDFQIGTVVELTRELP